MAATPAVIRTESNGHIVSGIAIGFVAASAAILSLRLYTRLVLLRTAGKDDSSIVIAEVRANRVCILFKYTTLTLWIVIRNRCDSCNLSW